MPDNQPITAELEEIIDRKIKAGCHSRVKAMKLQIKEYSTTITKIEARLTVDVLSKEERQTLSFYKERNSRRLVALKDMLRKEEQRSSVHRGRP